MSDPIEEEVTETINRGHGCEDSSAKLLHDLLGRPEQPTIDFSLGQGVDEPEHYEYRPPPPPSPSTESSDEDESGDSDGSSSTTSTTSGSSNNIYKNATEAVSEKISGEDHDEAPPLLLPLSAANGRREQPPGMLLRRTPSLADLVVTPVPASASQANPMAVEARRTSLPSSLSSRPESIPAGAQQIYSPSRKRGRQLPLPGHETSEPVAQPLASGTSSSREGQPALTPLRSQPETSTLMVKSASPSPPTSPTPANALLSASPHKSSPVPNRGLAFGPPSSGDGRPVQTPLHPEIETSGPAVQPASPSSPPSQTSAIASPTASPQEASRVHKRLRPRKEPLASGMPSSNKGQTSKTPLRPESSTSGPAARPASPSPPPSPTPATASSTASLYDYSPGRKRLRPRKHPATSDTPSPSEGQPAKTSLRPEPQTSGSAVPPPSPSPPSSPASVTASPAAKLLKPSRGRKRGRASDTPSSSEDQPTQTSLRPEPSPTSPAIQRASPSPSRSRPPSPTSATASPAESPQEAPPVCKRLRPRKDSIDSGTPSLSEGQRSRTRLRPGPSSSAPAVQPVSPSPPPSLTTTTASLAEIPQEASPGRTRLLTRKRPQASDTPSSNGGLPAQTPLPSDPLFSASAAQPLSPSPPPPLSPTSATISSSANPHKASPVRKRARPRHPRPAPGSPTTSSGQPTQPPSPRSASELRRARPRTAAARTTQEGGDPNRSRGSVRGKGGYSSCKIGPSNSPSGGKRAGGKKTSATTTSTASAPATLRTPTLRSTALRPATQDLATPLSPVADPPPASGTESITRKSSPARPTPPGAGTKFSTSQVPPPPPSPPQPLSGLQDSHPVPGEGVALTRRSGTCVASPGASTFDRTRVSVKTKGKRRIDLVVDEKARNGLGGGGDPGFGSGDSAGGVWDGGGGSGSDGGGHDGGGGSGSGGEGGGGGSGGEGGGDGSGSVSVDEMDQVGPDATRKEDSAPEQGESSVRNSGTGVQGPPGIKQRPSEQQCKGRGWDKKAKQSVSSAGAKQNKGKGCGMQSKPVVPSADAQKGKGKERGKQSTPAVFSSGAQQDKGKGREKQSKPAVLSNGAQQDKRRGRGKKSKPAVSSGCAQQDKGQGRGKQSKPAVSSGGAEGGGSLGGGGRVGTSTNESLPCPARADDAAQPENNARTQDRGLNGSAETAGSAKQARAGGRVSRQGAPSADKLAGGGTCNNNADGIGGVGAGADAGASVDASADIVDDDGPPTTIDEDLALVLELNRESEGLLAVRQRLRREVMALQDEEDGLRRLLGLPATRPTPCPGPVPPVPVETPQFMPPIRTFRIGEHYRPSTKRKKPGVTSTPTPTCEAPSPDAAPARAQPSPTRQCNIVCEKPRAREVVHNSSLSPTRPAAPPVRTTREGAQEKAALSAPAQRPRVPAAQTAPQKAPSPASAAPARPHSPPARQREAAITQQPGIPAAQTPARKSPSPAAAASARPQSLPARQCGVDEEGSNASTDVSDSSSSKPAPVYASGGDAPEVLPVGLPGSPVGSLGSSGGASGGGGDDMFDLANMLMDDADDALSTGGSAVDIETFNGMRTSAPAAAPVTVAPTAAVALRGRDGVMGRVGDSRGRGTGDNDASLSRMRAQLVARGRGSVRGGGGRQQKCRGAKRTNYTNLSPNATVKRRDSGRGGGSRGRMGTRGGINGLVNARGRGRGRGPASSG